MKTGAENRKKTVGLGILGAVAVSGVLYNLFALFGPSTPPPTIAPPTSTPAPILHRPGSAAANGGAGGTTTNGAGGGTANSNGRAAGAVPGVAAQKLASSAIGQDPTLDAAAMLRTENLVYTGSGRNIFSATYTPVAAAVLPRNVPSARPFSRPPVPVYVPAGPPPPPPIPLKFFGTAQRGRGAKQVFLLSGEDVYLASVGEIVARRFRVDQIMPFGVQMTDLVNNVTQTLPMQQQ